MGKQWPYAVVAALVFFLPLAGSWYAAREGGRQAAFDQTRLMSLSVLRRAESVGEQADRATYRLRAVRGESPCTDANLALMREIALGSSQLLAVGYVDGDLLLCSSLGVHRPPIVLGPPRSTDSLLGLQWRIALRLPLDPGQTRVVGVRDGVAVVMAPELITELYPDMHGIAIGVATSGGVGIAGRGRFLPAWRQHLGTARTVAFADGPRIVSLQRSSRYDIVSYVAVPTAYAHERARALFLTLLPLSLLVGGVCCAAIVYRMRAQREIPGMIREGLRHGEFFLMYQPIVELATGRWTGAEALIRWERSDGSMVRPDVFVPVAEESGLIQQLSRHVLKLLAGDAPAILAVRPDFRFSVNLSQEDLTNPMTLDQLRGLVATGIKPANLAIEATERGVMEKEAAGEVLRQIRRLGMRVAIDDFGTGYANLAHLQNFEVDSIKIDKSFVDTIGTEAVTAHVALLIIQMGRRLSLDLVAEGVENTAQADYLRDNGVHYGQGWLFSRPMRADGLRSALSALQASYRSR